MSFEFIAIFSVTMFLLQGLLKLLLVLPVLGSDSSQHTSSSYVKINDRTCTIIPSGGDDAPSIVAAFRLCNKDHTILFENKTYHVNQVMSTHGLDNVTIDIRGTVLVGVKTVFVLMSQLIGLVEHQYGLLD
jgi:galacturan 1,4-alpha-galacturonidase